MIQKRNYHLMGEEHIIFEGLVIKINFLRILREKIKIVKSLEYTLLVYILMKREYRTIID